MSKSPKNRYISRAKIAEAQFCGFVRCFALDLEATKIATLTGMKRNTVNRLTRLTRLRIAEECGAFARGPWTLFDGLPVGMRYTFGTGANRCGMSFRVLLNERQEVALFPEATEAATGTNERPLVPAGEGGASETLITVLPMTGWCDLNHVKTTLTPALVGARRTIEAFWLSARMRLIKFRGILPGSLPLHLRECEFRFNHRRDNLEEVLLEMVRRKTLV